MSEIPTYQDVAAAEVRAVMARERVTQVELAARLNVRTAWLHRRLAGATPISINELADIATALKVPVSDLIPAERVA